MDNVSDIFAALNAGKLPSHAQVTQYIEWFQANTLPQAKAATQSVESAKLSSQGEVLIKHVNAVLDAYKTLSKNKNSDDLLQESLWHLSQPEIKGTPSKDIPVDTDEVKSDVQAIQESIRGLLTILWSSMTSESSALFLDFTSFARLALADAAEVVEEQAARAKQGLRETEHEVQDGKRDTLGRDKERLKQEEDIKVSFAHGMDTLKDSGVSAIGAGQDASSKVTELAEKTSSRLQATFEKIFERAQHDKDYHQSISTLINIAEKWLTRTEETVTTTDVDQLFHDDTPDQHLSKAIQGLKKLAERFAGNKSLDSVYAKGRKCAVHIQNDQNLQAWFHDFFTVIRRTLDESGFVKSDEFQRSQKELRTRWRRFFEDDTEWKRDWESMKDELSAFENAVREDKDLSRLREAHMQLGKAVEGGLMEGSKEAQTGLQAAMDQASWFWRDIFQVYLPRFLHSMRDVPIPRTEYVDNDVEMVLENLDISSFNVNPAHIFIRNITDIDIQTSATSAPTKADIGTLTHIRVQAVQLTLKDVSFYYKDKQSSVGPSEFSGLMSFTLPPKGINFDIKLRLIPAHQTVKLKRGGTTFDMNERELEHGFHHIELAQAEITSDIDLSIKESNHAIMLSVFKPIATMRFREALEKALSEQIRGALKWSDGVAWEVSQRSEVFKDSGLGTGGALAAAIWSEMGKWRRAGGGWEAMGTGTGLVVEGEEGQAFAMGAEPQILSGDKRGPLGIASTSLEERLQTEGIDVASARDATGQLSKGVGKQARHLAQEGKKELQSFKYAVETKAERESKKPGWRSTAFDIRA